MAEIKHVYSKTLPPHIHSEDSLPKRYWGQGIALAPVFAAACLTGRSEILRILLLCLVSVVAFEFLAAKLFKKKERLQSGEAVSAAALFALLLPSGCPSEIVILGVFVAVFAAREFFGGTGTYLFHPLLIARVFLQVSFPEVMAEPLIVAGEGHPGLLIGIGLGGVLLLKQKQGYWETPVLLMAICFLWEALLGGNGAPYAFFSGVLFTAFFLLADPVTMPLTRRGTRIFVLGAAVLSVSLGREGFSIGTAAYAILLMDLLTPWLDVWLKPVPRRSQEAWKATYPL